MNLRAILIILGLLVAQRIMAQDTLALSGQPNWSKGLPVYEYCTFYEETGKDTLSFEQVQQKRFIFYADSLRRERFSARPLLIQWIRINIRNTSAIDTIQLKLNVGAHYFVKLYSTSGLIARSGIYETSVKGFNKSSFPITILPLALNTYWIRTEDRQNLMVPPYIGLETPYTFITNSIDGVRNDRLLFLLLSALTGCLFFITLFAAYQYVLYRDKAFLWYMAYTLTATFVGLFWIDIRHQFGIFSSLGHDLIFSVFLFFIPVLYTLFIGSMLKLPQQFPKVWTGIRILLGVACLQMIIEFSTIRTSKFIFHEYYAYFVSLIPVVVLTISLLVLASLSREKVKWFMFGGLAAMLLLWCMPMIIFPNIQITWGMWNVVLIFVPFYLLTGLTLEAICFSFALSYRNRLVLTEKNNLQVRYNLELQQALEKQSAELERKNRIVAEQKVRQIQTDFEKKLAETEMTALRAQMNPHFIFNCLNSIKLYMLQNDSHAASEYLTLFSQLIRLVLENSRSEKITLQKEIETLRCYLALEGMRFKDKIQYTIQLMPGIDADYIELPPLLTQPFVENAIWHGLMHRSEGGTITITIAQPAEHELCIEVLDDGVGREQAAIYKSKSATVQKSFGLKMTTERMNVINHAYGIHADVNVEDVMDGLTVAGTRVTIIIPI
jgi:sensor histidine kinase YesM